MTALRQLSVVYVAAAGAYAIAMAMSAHPGLVRDANETTRYLRTHVADTAVAFDDHVLRPDLKAAESVGRDFEQSIASAFHHAPVRIAHALPAHQKLAQLHPAPPSAVAQLAMPPVPNHTPPPMTAKDYAPPAPDYAAPDAPASPSDDNAPLRGSSESTAPTAEAALPQTPPPHLKFLPQMAPQSATPPATSTASLPPQGPPDAGEIMRVEDRLKASLTSEMVDNFSLFLYVSKANAGPWAQRMYVFQKGANGDLNLLYNWPVSTGREELELNPQGRKLMTDTPSGYYELDPHRSYEQYTSSEWGQKMPYAMFFNWVKDGDKTGLAIHSAVGDDATKLGSRASAGCIHLSEDNARTLFTMIRTQYKGLAPRFAYDRRTGTMSNQGILLHDASGKLQMAEGYKVLVFIEDYGGENIVAALF
jgi:lipoprotein-anchoring transpeptidase ErfK/SrfK